jgi:hypothetical protein
VSALPLQGTTPMEVRAPRVRVPQMQPHVPIVILLQGSFLQLNNASFAQMLRTLRALRLSVGVLARSTTIGVRSLVAVYVIGL